VVPLRLYLKGAGIVEGQELYVLLTAGGDAPAEIRHRTGALRKALIPLKGRLLFTYVLDAVLALPESKRVLVSCGESSEGFPLPPAPCVRYFDGAHDIVEAIERAADILRAEIGDACLDGELMIAAIDVPLVTSEQLRQLIERARELHADVVWPLVEREVVEAEFPGSRRTYVKTRQGTFTGGNVFLVKPRPLLTQMRLLRRIFKHRKNPLALASIFGLGLIVKLLSGGISVPAMEEGLSARLGVKLRALLFEHPEIAVDLDKLVDLEQMEEFLSQSPVASG